MNGILLPVIPSCAEGEYHRGQPVETPKVMHLLDRYHDHLGDTVIQFEENINMAEAVLSQSGKQLVPAVLGDREESIFRWEEAGLKTRWIRWILDNLDRLAGVQIGNIVVETTNHFCPHVPTEQIVGRLYQKFPMLAGKMVLAPWHYDVIRDMGTEGFPIREAIRTCCDWFTIYWGYELLSDPPCRMREWLKPVQVYSGINFSEGARDHNLRKSLDAGYAGCLFFLPVHGDQAVGDRLMDSYLTDVPR